MAGGVFTYLVDLSVRLRSEREQERIRTGKLRRSTQALIDSMTEHIALIDGRGRITAVNRAWSRFAADNDGSAATGVGANYFAVCRRAAQAGDRCGAAALRGIQGVVSGTCAEFVLEYPCHSPTEKRWFVLMASAMPAGAILSHINITKRRLAEEALRSAYDRLEVEVAERTEQLRQTNARLRQEVHVRLAAEEGLRRSMEEAEAANRAKAEFLDIASHELRTPLTPLRLLLQHSRRTLEEGKNLPVTVLDRMQRQADRLGRMVGDLLDTSRLERGRVVLQPVCFDLRALVTETVQDYRDQYPDRPLVEELPETPALVEADPQRIQQVVTNLIDNAIKYSPPGSKVTIQLDLPPAAARLSVTDHGPGIPPAEQTRLFSRFFRAESEQTRRKPGLGLGLYISRQIIELHGGTIGVKSRVGEGSTFYFVLPRGGGG